MYETTGLMGGSHTVQCVMYWVYLRISEKKVKGVKNIAEEEIWMSMMRGKVSLLMNVIYSWFLSIYHHRQVFSDLFINKYFSLIPL